MKKLYFKQKVFKITDHYEVYDENQDIQYYVNQNFRFIGFNVTVTDFNENYIFNIEREIFSFFPRFYINFSNGSNVVMQSKFALFGKVIDIDPDELGLVLEGNFFDHDFSIYREGEIIATISKQYISWGDTFEILAYDEYYIDIILAITIGVDCIKDLENSRSN